MPITSIAVVDTGEKNGKPTEQVVREVTLDNRDIGVFKVEYRHGVVCVGLSDGTKFSSYIANGAATTASVCSEAFGSPAQLNRFVVHANEKPLANEKRTAEERRKLEQAHAENRKVVQLYRKGDFNLAVNTARQVLATRREILGKEHLDYATSLNNLASLYHSKGDHALAEPLYLEAKAIEERVLGKEHPNYARSLNNLAALYKSMGEYARARPLFVEAVGIKERLVGKEHPAYATSLNNLAALYHSMGEYAQAEPLFVEAKAIEGRVNGIEHPSYTTTVNNLAALYKSMGEYARAESLYVEAKTIRGKVIGKEHPDYAASLNNLAALYHSMGEYARARPLFVEAKTIREKVLGTEHPDYAASLNNLAALYSSMGEYSRARSLYVEAVGIKERLVGKEHPAYATSLNNLAALYHSMGEYAQAEPLFVEAKAIEGRVNGIEHPSYTTTVNNLAALYKSMGEYARAESLYVEAKTIRGKVIGKEHPDYAASLNNLAALYHLMGEHARAESLFVEAKAIYAIVLGKDHPLYAASLNNLAVLYRSTGEYARAVLLYMQAKEIFANVSGKEHPVNAKCLNNLAGLYRSMGEYARAESFYLEAKVIEEKVLGRNHPGYASTLNNLGSLYLSTGEHAQAEPLFTMSKEICARMLGVEHPDYAAALNNSAMLFASMGNYGSAESDVLAARDVLIAAATRSVPGSSDAQARKWMSANAPRIDFVLSILQGADNSNAIAAYPTVWNTKLMVSRLRVGLDLPPDASPEAATAFAQLRDARLKLAKLVSATPSPEQADGYRKALAAANENKEDLEKKLARLNPASRRELAIRDASIEDLLMRLPEGVAVVDFVRTVSWSLVDKQIEWKLDDGRTEKRIVKEQNGTPVYHAFVLRSDRRSDDPPALWVPLGAAEPIDSAITHWRKQFGAEGTKGDVTSASAGLGKHDRTLRELIWDKLEPQLDGVQTVVILPDGDLSRLPWSALPGRNPGEYLIHDYALTTAASGQQLFGILAAPPIESESNLLVAGGIQYDQRPPARLNQDGSKLGAPSQMVSHEERSWRFLKGAEREAEVVSELWADRGRVRRLGGLQADERTLARQLPQFRFAHLATHGFFDTQGDVYRVNLREQSLFQPIGSDSNRGATVAARNPLMMTGIVMAGANVPPNKDEYGLPTGDDGILTAEEISGLDLRDTDLVTLSACQTSLGDIAAGQGVFGLQRVLHQSGVRSVVASLWKVDDQATLTLMTEFYRNLWIRKLSKIQSLREAQLAMLNRYDLETGELRGLGTTPGQIDPNKKPKARRLDPRFWAAFQLSGDWR